MDGAKKLGRFSLGVGDRFEQEATAQLKACALALEQGVEVVPVWNKSNREHLIVGSKPSSTREACDRAVRAVDWKRPYFVDADHIRLETVDRFLPYSDFYTIDVADSIGQLAERTEVEQFLRLHGELACPCDLKGLSEPLHSTREKVEEIARKYLVAVRQAGRVYHHIQSKLGAGNFVTEVSLDETDEPQTALELLVLLAALADEGVPVQTIAPRFCGCFHKGIDYIGDIGLFERQFRAHLTIIAHSIDRYVLPGDLKISLHSGSDKFSLYGPIRRALAQFGAGLHLKTAGTTWLEELSSIAEGGGRGLNLGKAIALEALQRIDELCAPYRNVVSIRIENLPRCEEILAWGAAEFVSAIRHDRRNPLFNPDFRQLLHVGYKLAAEKWSEFTAALDSCRSIAARNVTRNLFERHMKPLFLPEAGSVLRQPKPPGTATPSATL